MARRIPIEFYAASTGSHTSYGLVGHQMYDALRELGADVRLYEGDLQRNRRDAQRISPPGEIADSPRRREVVRVNLNVPPLWKWGEARWRVGISMWESSVLPYATPVRRDRMKSLGRPRRLPAHQAVAQLRALLTEAGYTIEMAPGGPEWQHKVLWLLAREVGMDLDGRLAPDDVVVVNWRDYCNTGDLVVVPTRHNLEVFTASGVRTPIGIMPLGIDAQRWRPLTRPPEKSSPYIFLMHGDLDYRKGFDIAYQAFWSTFGDDPAAHLVLKTRGMALYANWKVLGTRWPIRFLDRNVTLLRGDWRLAPQYRTNGRSRLGGLMRLMQMADCYVFPSRGEGYGLPPREAAATGLPAIVPRAHAFDTPDLDRWAIPIENVKRVTADYRVWSKAGEFYEADVDELGARMRWCFEHRNQALAMGAAASQYVRQWTWQDAAERLIDLLCGGLGIERKDLVND